MSRPGAAQRATSAAAAGVKKALGLQPAPHVGRGAGHYLVAFAAPLGAVAVFALLAVALSQKVGLQAAHPHCTCLQQVHVHAAAPPPSYLREEGHIAGCVHVFEAGWAVGTVRSWYIMYADVACGADRRVASRQHGRLRAAADPGRLPGRRQRKQRRQRRRQGRPAGGPRRGEGAGLPVKVPYVFTCILACPLTDSFPAYILLFTLCQLVSARQGLCFCFKAMSCCF